MNSLKVFTNCHGFNESGLVRAIWHKPYLPDSMYVPADILYECIWVGTVGSRIHVPHSPGSRRAVGPLGRRIRRQTQPQTR